MKKKWNEMPLPDRIASVLSVVIGLIVIALALIQILDIWRDAAYVYIPLLGVNQLLLAYVQWKSNRKAAIVSLCAVSFVFACTIAVYLLK